MLRILIYLLCCALALAKRILGWLIVNIFMPPFEEEGVYCFAMSVGLSVGRSVDQMVSADYLKYHSSQSLHISHVGWS